MAAVIAAAISLGVRRQRLQPSHIFNAIDVLKPNPLVLVGFVAAHPADAIDPSRLAMSAAVRVPAATRLCSSVGLAASQLVDPTHD